MKNSKSKMDVTKESYNQIADKFRRKLGKPDKVEKEKDKFVELVGKGKVILDLGCGIGRHVKFFSERGLKVIGIDNSTSMLEVARENIPSGDLREMDMLDLVFDDSSFDGVWAKASIVHIPKSKVPEVLEEINRVLRQKGVFFVSFREGNAEKMEILESYDNKPRFYSYYAKEEIQNVLTSKGFEILESRSYYHHGENWMTFLCKKL